MILRRFSRHVKDQNWFAVSLDLLVVIVGIFLGLQVGEWNNSRKQDAEIELTRQKLLEDFTTIAGEARTYTRWHAEVTRDMAYLTHLVRGDGAAEADDTRIRATLANSDISLTYPKPSATYQAVMSAGRVTQLIPDEKLRLALIEYHRALMNAQESVIQIRVLLTEYAPAFQKHFSVDVDMEIQEERITEIPFPGVLSYDLEAMKADPEFIQAAGQYFRGQYFLMIDQRAVLLAAKDVLTLLAETS